MIEKLPCPFCGREKAQVKYSSRWGFFVSCGSPCNAVGPSADSKVQAIQAWNRRFVPNQGKLELGD